MIKRECKRTEDDEIFEEVFRQMDEFYETVGYGVPFYDIKEDLTHMVVGALGMGQEEAYEFVCTWFDNKHKETE